MKYFKTEEEKRDAKYVEDQILFLINKVLLWKNKQKEHGISIFMLVISKHEFF